MIILKGENFIMMIIFFLDTKQSLHPTLFIEKKENKSSGMVTTNLQIVISRLIKMKIAS